MFARVWVVCARLYKNYHIAFVHPEAEKRSNRQWLHTFLGNLSKFHCGSASHTSFEFWLRWSSATTYLKFVILCSCNRIQGERKELLKFMGFMFEIHSTKYTIFWPRGPIGILRWLWWTKIPSFLTILVRK